MDSETDMPESSLGCFSEFCIGSMISVSCDAVFSAGVSSVSTLTSGNTGESEQVVGVAIEASGLVADPSNS